MKILRRKKKFADSGQVELMRFPITIGATGFTFDVVLFCHTKQMDPYIFHIALNQHRDLNIKMEHGEAFSIFIMVLIPLR